MKGFASIGAVYSIPNPKKYEVDSKILYTCSGLGIILPPDGDIVIENGREYVKPREEIKEIIKTLKLKK